MFSKKKKPEDVFTPRSAVVNETMYVTRRVLEDRLEDSLRGSKYVVVHGESGNGKTWLYKKVLKQIGCRFEIVNLANAKLYGSLSSALDYKLGDLGFSEGLVNETTTTGGVRPQGIGVEVQAKTTEVFQARGAFLKLIMSLRQSAGKKPTALIFENFEQIMDDDDLLSQLRALIISADDEEVSAHNVKVIIVGVPGNIKDLIAKTSGANPIINRLTEIPEVGRIERDDAVELLERGLFHEIGLTISSSLESDFEDATVTGETEICEKIAFYTDGIAQQIHECALAIALEAERNNGVIDTPTIEDGIRNWVTSSLSADWAIIDAHMNSRNTEVGRKNQVLFCMCRMRRNEFRTMDIERQLKSEFDLNGKVVNASQILSSFSSGDNPILERTPKDDAWRFLSPRLKIVLRAALEKNDRGRVIKADYMEKFVQ